MDNVNDADPSVRVDSLNDVSLSDNEYVSLLDITTSTISSSMVPDFKFKVPSPPSVKPKRTKLANLSVSGVSSPMTQSEVLQSSNLPITSGYSCHRNKENSPTLSILDEIVDVFGSVFED